MTMKSDREYRAMTMAVREDAEERKIVTGYATTFNEPYTLFEDDEIIFREQVDSKAFENTDMADVIMQYDHAGRVFARTSNETLKIGTDETGLFIEADLGGTELGRGLFEEIRGRYTTKMSFGFKVRNDESIRTKTDDGRIDILRTITDISKLYDVSAVSIPANDGTSIGAETRHQIDGEIEAVRAERREAERLELERLRAEVRARALGKEIEES